MKNQLSEQVSCSEIALKKILPKGVKGFLDVIKVFPLKSLHSPRDQNSQQCLFTQKILLFICRGVFMRLNISFEIKAVLFSENLFVCKIEINISERKLSPD